MELHVLGSGSNGNCYLLKPKFGGELLIECGIKFKQIKEQLNFNISNIAGCLLSHEHGDHAKCTHELINSGINVFMSLGTKESLNLPSAIEIKENEIFKIDDFRIMAFNVYHDAKQPFGFLIHHLECGLIFFATDTTKLNYEISKVDHWIIEANFSESIMIEQLKKEKLNGHLANRIYNNHMSIENAIELLQSNDLNRCKTITLIHLSGERSWDNLFIDMVERKIGITPFLAKKDLKIKF